MQIPAKLSVPEAVRTIITGNQPVYTCLKMGLINYTALATRIKPEVEKLVGDNVNLNTIVVAIKRFTDSVERAEETDKRSDELKQTGARISLTGGIMDVGLDEIDRFDKDISDFLHQLFGFDPEFSLFQSESSIRIFTEDVESVRELFSTIAKRFDVDVQKGFAKISIKLPIDANQKLGIISLISDLLYRNGISLHDAFFGHDEILLVVDEDVAAKAYDLLRTIFSGGN